MKAELKAEFTVLIVLFLKFDYIYVNETCD